MEGTQKINSVLDLAKYKVGQVLFWVVFRPVHLAHIKIPQGEEWLANAHPATLFERGLAPKAWRLRERLPHLCAMDFQYVVDLLTSEPIVERFEIVEVIRSQDTGGFFYANRDSEWMREEDLFSSVVMARREKERIKNMFKRWAEGRSPDQI